MGHLYVKHVLGKKSAGHKRADEEENFGKEQGEGKKDRGQNSSCYKRQRIRSFCIKRANKGLLAGLYEFPNVEGHLKEEEVITYLKKMGLSPIRLKKLEDSRHIFSHIEWHMTGYAVQIDETEQEYQNMLFVDVKETEEQYPIPAAFSRYTGYMNIRLGNDRYKEE